MAEYSFSRAFPYLLARVGARMGDVMAAELVKEGLTLQTYRILAALRERDDQRLIDLADMVSSDVSTLSRQIGTLIAMNYVSRERVRTDGRIVRIALTPDGRATVERWIPCAMHYEALATRDFSASELATLRTMLERVFANLAGEGDRNAEHILS